jgi:cysteine desulfurase / selenocysteine lyase
MIGDSAMQRPARFDVESVRHDFPILTSTPRDRRLVYLDNASTTQKPQAVIDRLSRYYSAENANVHRGVHRLSELATAAYEQARDTMARFIGASDRREIVFVRGTTEAINLVAATYGRSHVRRGDEVLVSEMEHHSNIVPWQMLCEEQGARLRVAPIDDAGNLDLEKWPSLLTDRTRIVAVTHVSNALGTVNPVREIVRLAHERGIPVLVDGAQAVSHMNVDVRNLDCDFYAFSGHKMFGPTGIGVLYGRASLLDAMPPYQSGGDMISSVSFARTHFNVLPYKFEAGTPDISGAVGLAAAVEYLDGLGWDAIATHEDDLLAYGTRVLAGVSGVRLVGTAQKKVGVLSFVIDGVHPHDVGTILDREGIAIRAGHHCCQPLMDRLGIPATARVSLALYNTRDEIEAVGRAVQSVRERFA